MHIKPESRRMVRRIFGLGVAILIASSVQDAAAQQLVKRIGAQGSVMVSLEQASPRSANPYLGLLPEGITPDWEYWNAWMKDAAAKRRQSMAPAAGAKVVDVAESEPNDSRGTADPVPGFGSGGGDDSSADLSGGFPAGPVPSPLATLEDNGSITLATPTGLTSGSSVIISTLIGDGPFGITSGDFDFYSIPNVSVGQTIFVDVDTPTMGASGLDSFVVLWDSSGFVLSFNDDEGGGSLDSQLLYTSTVNGTLYVSVGDFFAIAPEDPFDSSSGEGVGGTGVYDVTISLDTLDEDYFSVDLEAGDIFGALLLGGGTHLSLFDPSGTLRVASFFDFSGIYSSQSPLPGGGNAVLAYVIETAGTYTVRILGGGGGAYTAELRVFRPPSEGVAGSKQILFIDFDSATFDTVIFGQPGVVTLSRLDEFLPRWGLSPSDKNEVIDAILATVEENVRTDPLTFGLNAEFDVDIRNSRDDGELFGRPKVSRVIVGGTIEESGIGTIGIAESIDIGNFGFEETAIVLLDLLSEVPENPNSLNSFPLDPSVTVIDIIAAGVGNVVAHEAGHFFGNFHTDSLNLTPSIMDEGGNMAGLVGVGVDGIFGTGDDVDVDFSVDVYSLFEGFIGVEDTLNEIAFALTSGPPGPPGPSPEDLPATGAFGLAMLVLVCTGVALWRGRGFVRR